jgi:hypothetical protein
MSLDLQTNATGQLVLITADGTRHENVRPARIFPLTDADHWIALQDATGRELACIDDPATLPESQRIALQTALTKRAFVPVIQSIERITRAADGYVWHVITDRGPTTFHVETDEAVQTLGAGRLVIIDDHNTRYLIPNATALDDESKRRMERYY